MKFKKLARIMCTLALAGAAVAVSATMTGCKNGHAEAEITIEYDGVSYVLEYTLYRNMYPQTVQHFIELADTGFYNNTIIHDYQTSNWYGGGYKYIADDYAAAYDEGKDGLREYLDWQNEDGACKEKEYYNLADPAKGVITPTVYDSISEGKYVNPYRTLIGEFSSNQHKIENGALKNSYGALKFYYQSITGDEGKKHVYLNKEGSGFGVQGEYRYNCATSLFSIQTGTSTSSDSTHCIFATLDNTDTLKSLRTAVQKSYDYTDVKLYVNNYDEILGPNKSETSYRLTKKPIIVKSVRITKY